MDEVTILFFFRGFFLDVGVTVIDDCLFMNAFFFLYINFGLCFSCFILCLIVPPELRSFSHGEFSEQIHEFM